MVLVMPGMLVLVPNDPLTPTVQYTAYTMGVIISLGLVIQVSGLGMGTGAMGYRW